MQYNLSRYAEGFPAERVKDDLQTNLRDLNQRVSSLETKLKILSQPNQTDSTNAIVLVVSKDFGLCKQSMLDAIDKKNYSFVISLGNLIENSTKLYRDVERFEAKRLSYKAKDLSGYLKQQDAFNQSKVILTELEGYIDLIGTVGYKDLLSQVNMKRAPVELQYEMNKQKIEQLRD